MTDHELPSIVGVVGLSPLGAAIARRLAAKCVRVAAYDTDRAAHAHLAGASRLVETAANLAGIGHDCELVVSTLDGGALSTVMIGSPENPGLGLLLAPGSLVVDMGASSPHDARRLAFVLGSRGIGLVDAPALGSPDDAAAGALTIPLGGYPDFVERARPVLELLGAVTTTGQIGSGHTLAALLTAKTTAEARIRDELTSLAAATGVVSPFLVRGEGAGVEAAGHDPATAIRRAVARGLAGQHGAAAALQMLIDDEAHRRPAMHTATGNA